MIASTTVTIERILDTLSGFLYQCRNDQERTFSYVSDGFQACTGLPPEAVAANPGLRHSELIHPEDRAAVETAIQDAIHQRRPFDLHYRIVLPDQAVRHISDRGSPSFGPDGTWLGLAGFIAPSPDRNDSDADAGQEDRLRQLAYADPLTGLPNRQAVLEWLERALGEEQNAALLILNLDIDNFQWINNTFGRKQADHVIQVMAEELRKLVRAGDLVARLQSDEFLLILQQPATSASDGNNNSDTPSAWITTPGAEAFLQELRVNLNTFLERRQDIPYIPGYCIGCRQVNGHGHGDPSSRPDSGDVLLLEANTALSEAKRSGVNRQSVFMPEMSRIIQRQIQLESRLSQAQQLEEFCLYFQPIVRRDGLIVGAEALMRWPQSDGSFIPPYLFIPLLEKNGRIREVGRWLIGAAFRQLAQWRSDGLALDYLSINISAAQLLSKEVPLHELLLATINNHQLEPSAILLEITETAVLENMELARLELERLTSLGFGIALDDFGTGYSSLLTLLQLPISALKIDKSFVDGIAGQAKSIALVETCISMADKLDLRCIAEGVESELQCQRLRKIGCQYFQGYLYDQALPPQELEQRLRRQQAFSGWPRPSQGMHPSPGGLQRQ